MSELKTMDELHKVLTDMLSGIAANGGSATSEGTPLTAHIQKLDSLRVDLAGEMPNMLAHYLEKRSYTKALDFLEGRDEAEAPNC